MMRVEDARAAVQCGADAVGMVLHANTPRRIGLDVARQIIAVLPPFVTPIGLFVDAPAERVVEVADELHLNHVQLHGHESPDFVAALGALRVIKMIRVTRDGLSDALAPWRKNNSLAAILLETGSTAQAGGTGVENDWDTIEAGQAAGMFEGLPPIIAAGGLRPDNVARVIQRLRPYAVDVSSGIEATRGVKSVEKMQLFADNVRDCDE
jgi:phosphoribosylanthranilate isomerase